MLRKVFDVVVLSVVVLMLSHSARAADATSELKVGTVKLQSAGPMTFGPDGVLFVGDTAAAAIHAIATGDVKGDPEGQSITVEGINQKVAAALGASAADIIINDMAVNPASGTAYLSVSRGRGPDATAVILTVDGKGTIKELNLNNVKCDSVEIPNAPAPGGGGREDQRSQSITDLEYTDGKLLVAGLSNEEFASKLHTIPFPFKPTTGGASVEVFHGNHGRLETRSPIRTFAMMVVDEEPQVLAAYTCTPLVRFPVSDLSPGTKVTGTTVAELGNRNRPLDMIVYEKDGSDYILMSNNARGVMKIATDDIGRKNGITERVREETSGQKYDTLDELEGVIQLAQLNSKQALIIQEKDGRQDLRTIALP